MTNEFKQAAIIFKNAGGEYDTAVDIIDDVFGVGHEIPETLDPGAYAEENGRGQGPRAAQTTAASTEEGGGGQIESAPQAMSASPSPLNPSAAGQILSQYKQQKEEASTAGEILRKHGIGLKPVQPREPSFAAIKAMERAELAQAVSRWSSLHRLVNGKSLEEARIRDCPRYAEAEEQDMAEHSRMMGIRGMNAWLLRTLPLRVANAKPNDRLADVISQPLLEATIQEKENKDAQAA